MEKDLEEVFGYFEDQKIYKLLKDEDLLKNLKHYMQAETHKHTVGVSRTAVIIAKNYGLTEQDIAILKVVAPLHDFGKLNICTSILNKKGKLTNFEMEIMKFHTHIGADLLKQMSDFNLKIASVVAMQHHEKWDGTGYPFGLKGHGIDLYARIISCSDVLDALLQKREYKEAWSFDKVFKLFEDERGLSFDPILTDIVLSNFEEITKHYII